MTNVYNVEKNCLSVSEAKPSSNGEKEMLPFPDSDVGSSPQIFSHKRLEVCKNPYHEACITKHNSLPQV